ncbi:unnamed protein product [Didymodactylos carnosus]|nr:unnamed protein product [Didymodactylos carnosus]CAF4528856.1 unnamed protein product [Didymodactylos carnosus]
MVVLIGSQGILISAFIIGVITNNLQFTTTENYFIKFVEQIQLNKELKHQSSNIIKHGLKTWILKAVHPSLSHIKSNRKLLASIKMKNRIKHQQQQLANADDSHTAISSLMNNKQALDQQLQSIKTILLKIDKKLTTTTTTTNAIST